MIHICNYLTLYNSEKNITGNCHFFDADAFGKNKRMSIMLMLYSPWGSLPVQFLTVTLCLTRGLVEDQEHVLTLLLALKEVKLEK